MNLLIGKHIFEISYQVRRLIAYLSFETSFRFEISDTEIKAANIKAADQTVQMHSLICNFLVCLRDILKWPTS